MSDEHNTTSEVIRRFNDVFQRHDPAALPELVAKNCVIENTQPAPNGSRHVGQDACVALWREIATTPGLTSTSRMYSWRLTGRSSVGDSGGARAKATPCGASTSCG